MEDNKTCFGNFDKDNCECIICNVIVECCEYKEDGGESNMEFDTYGNNIICPYCRYENTDEELNDDDETGIIECGGCERPIRYSRYIDITYTTNKVDWLEEWKLYNHNISNQYSTMRMLKELNNKD